MSVLLYVVRLGPDDTFDHYTFSDPGVAEQAAAIVGGWIEPEPLMDARSLRALRAEHRPPDASAGRAA